MWRRTAASTSQVLSLLSSYIAGVLQPELVCDALVHETGASIVLSLMEFCSGVRQDFSSGSCCEVEFFCHWLVHASVQGGRRVWGHGGRDWEVGGKVWRLVQVCWRGWRHSISAGGSSKDRLSSGQASSSLPFGSLPGFVTLLGVVAVPDEPIGGYVYGGGGGAGTVWRLHAEAVYI